MSISDRYIARIGVLSGVILLDAMLTMSSASATTYYTYSYTGPNFTVVSGAYTTSDNISGSVTLTQPLGDSFSGPISSILYAFSFSDGVQKISSSTTGVYLFPGEDYFGTGLTGLITSWAFEMNIAGPAPQSYIATTNGDDIVETDSGASGAYVLKLGNWSSATTTTTTPLPAALPLFATGLGAMGLLSWRRKRKAAASIAAA
jgi:hypothetical protein